ncbi:AAA family ATPase [Thermophilibacter mediterraneus]|uniref:AAA family ATPase n=1 Tax=Thermophilibacter mediterraneus TaxID=1871031 RepID=UPI000AFAFB61|nr:AAA family ATPase [Thermophilibacter mediterraneus]
MYKRKVYDALLSWKRESKGALALLLEGARRTGKSTLARAFAENKYDSHLIIDFSVASEDIKDLFRMYRSDVDTFFMYLQAFTGVNLILRDPSGRAHPITAHADGAIFDNNIYDQRLSVQGDGVPQEQVAQGCTARPASELVAALSELDSRYTTRPDGALTIRNLENGGGI